MSKIPRALLYLERTIVDVVVVCVVAHGVWEDVAGSGLRILLYKVERQRFSVCAARGRSLLAQPLGVLVPYLADLSPRWQPVSVSPCCLRLGATLPTCRPGGSQSGISIFRRSHRNDCLSAVHPSTHPPKVNFPATCSPRALLCAALMKPVSFSTPSRGSSRPSRSDTRIFLRTSANFGARCLYRPIFNGVASLCLSA